ncbi:bromodomain-containing protein 4B-like [Dicentrarchus labrax]|uniref:bromodomain-containing protein 4B-like n=1 Tax=Dicentrarchus labrax TaxID=13489 RepID=UPI0021F51C05|nr:bromodomain-containing protein 4B-like [Dicentrarchus labrax]
MFSDSRAPAPGEQKGFKPHAPHFIPWLRNSLKPHHSSDLGLNGPYKSTSEARNSLTPLEKGKGIGFFSIQGKDRAKKGELRCNGVGMARMLPVVLRGHHILPGSLGKQREDSPARWNQSPELHPDSNTQMSPGDGPQGLSNSSTPPKENHTFVRNHSSHPSLPQLQNDGTSTSIRKYGPLVGPPPAPVQEEPNCKVPAVVGTEDRRGKVWDYGSSTTYRQRDLHSSSWVSSDTQGLIERQHGFTSSFSYIKQQSRNSQSQRDLTTLREPPVEGFNGPLNGVIFSTEVPLRGLGCTTTLRGPRKPRPSSEGIGVLGQNQTWVQYRPTIEGESQRKEAGCSRKVVRNQIKRVVDNLEQVLTALRDVHQEMKEVVQQIDNLTSSIDLNEEEQQRTAGGDMAKPTSDSSSSSGSSSSEVTVGSTHQRLSEPENGPGTTDSSGTLRRDHHSRSQSPPNVLLCPVNSAFSSERSRTLRFTCSLGSSPRQGGQLQYNNNLPPSNRPQLQNLTSHDLALSPQRNLPVRPPTPGLSPLTVNLHHPNGPGSQPPSPGPSSCIRVSPVSPPFPLSPKPHPPPTRSPSVIIENKIASYQTPQSDHPSGVQCSPSSIQPPLASCPPTNSETQTVSNNDRERRTSSAGSVHRPSQVCTAPTATAKPPTAQGRRGRKPPPYPHHRPSEHTKKVKEPRKAPPYPEKRRLLSTTV